MKTMPTRVDGELFAASKVAGDIQSRSAAQQLDHWARIGRELEESPTVTLDAINRVLTGQAPYDGLPDEAQAVVRVSWNEQISARIAGLDFEGRLREAGRPWAEADAEGNAVVRRPVLQPVTHLPVINAGEIATLRWPGQEAEYAYEASAAATAAHDDALNHRRSFIAETVLAIPARSG